MFELGLRFAFDKAAVIIKDNETGYSFDTSPVEHVNYRKDLRFSSIEEFKKDLFVKLIATFKKSKEANHSMYLQDFGKFVIKELDTKNVSENQYILEKLNEMQKEIKNISNTNLKDAKKNELIVNSDDRTDIKDLVKSLYLEYSNGGVIYSKSRIADLITITMEERYNTLISIRTVVRYTEQFIVEGLN